MQYPNQFQKDKCEKDLVYYFSVGDEKWTVFVSPEEARAEEGKKVEKADCIIKADPGLFIDMVTKGKMPKKRPPIDHNRPKTDERGHQQQNEARNATSRPTPRGADPIAP